MDTASLKKVLADIEGVHRLMEKRFPLPEFIEVGGISAWRYRETSELLMCFLKFGKIISTLNASVVLMEAGFPQEVGILARVGFELVTDIMFFFGPRSAEGLSVHQKMMVNDFFKEEFERYDVPLGLPQMRKSVPRSKVAAGVGKLHRELINPNDGIAVVQTLYKALSGYVHGAYPHTMELYLGSPPHFQLNGRLLGGSTYVIHLTHFASLVAELLAERCGAIDEAEKAKHVRTEFEKIALVMGTGSLADQLASMKHGKKSLI